MGKVDQSFWAFIFTGMNVDDNGQKRALLLHYAGGIMKRRRETHRPVMRPQSKYYMTLFPEKKTPQTEVYKFRNCKENPSQSLEEYVTELRKSIKRL